MNITITIKQITAAILVTAVAFSSYIVSSNVVSAAALANISNTMTSQTISTASNHTIVFRTPTGAADTTDTITLTFPAGFNMNAIAFDDVDLAFSAGAQSNCTAPSYVNDETLAATPAADTWGAALSGQVLTLTAPSSAFTTTIAANACVQVQIGTNATLGSTGNTQIINPGSANSYAIAIGGLFSDNGSTTVNIITDDTVDIAAEVAQSLTFSISDVSIGFGTLNSAAARFATGDTLGSAAEVEAHNIIVGTNAANGYSMTATGTTLINASNPSATITAIGATAAASSVGTEQFGLRMIATGGSGAAAAPYNTANFAYDSAAFPDQVASASGSTANTTYSLRYLANIAANTDAGTYNAAITYVATANF
ncbi:MAG: hypothetical protein RLZZ70_473 [Candidatus Parcubacteria bacterium]|jgi:hypothetical protein